MLKEAVQTAFEKKMRRGWDKWPRLYWAIDLHDVIIPGTYTRLNENKQFYPYAQEVLQWLTNRKDMCLILFTSSHTDSLTNVVQWINEFGINFDYINCNPECPDNELCSFAAKFFFDIMLEDKAGFNGLTDWGTIKLTLNGLDEWRKKEYHGEK